MVNIQRNLRNMNHYQNMLSSGKTITKPSDNPISVARVMSYNSVLSQNMQYQKNIHAATTFVETTESALKGINEVLQRARELALTGANGTMSEDDLRAVAKEVDELNNVLVQLANSSIEGRYVFAGFKTTSVPFARDKDLLQTEPSSVTYQGNTGSINWEVAPNVTIKGNLDGHTMFMDSCIFEYMDTLVQGLEGNDHSVIDDSIANLTEAIQFVLDNRAGLGAIVNGLELSREKYLDENLSVTQLRSTLEDIDLAKAIINFNVMENVYRSSLSTGARIMQPSLIDYLR